MGMFIERLLDQGSGPLLEQTLRFTAERHRLIAEDVVNVDTPNYRQKDLSVEKFQSLLRDRVETRREAGVGGERVGCDDVAAELPNQTAKPGVHVANVQVDPSPFQRRFEPGHPDADPQGYVSYPNIDLSVEYVNALEASRAYEANVSMMEVSKAMINASLRL